MQFANRIVRIWFLKVGQKQKQKQEKSHKIDGLGLGNLRGSGGVGIAGAAGMGGAVVLEPKALQRVRREEGLSSDHIQRRLRLLL